MAESLTEDQVVRLQRVLYNLARGQKRHPETAAAMKVLGGLLRMCARCGQSAVLGGPCDLTLCDRCASDVGYNVGVVEAAEQIDEAITETLGAAE